jgi:hypothetical protein
MSFSTSKILRTPDPFNLGKRRKKRAPAKGVIFKGEYEGFHIIKHQSFC